MTEAVSSGPTSSASSEDRNLAFVVYALLFIAPFLAGLSALAAVVIAYVRRPVCDPIMSSHYRFQIKVFWVGAVLTLLSVVALMYGLGIVFGDVFDALSNHGQGWDAWDVASVEEADFRFRPTSLIGFSLWLVMAGVTALWVMGASIFGSVRLASHQAIGRA
jgi:uncharacterized membrane protein